MRVFVLYQHKLGVNGRHYEKFKQQQRTTTYNNGLNNTVPRQG